MRVLLALPVIALALGFTSAAHAAGTKAPKTIPAQAPAAPAPAPSDEGGSATSTMNAHFGPVSLLVGSIMGGLDFQVNENWTVGPQVNYWKFNLSSTSSSFTSDFEIRQFSVGARGAWFKNGVFTDGLYVSPQLDYKSIKLTTRDSSGEVSGSLNGVFATALIGYGWFWDSFNIMLGIGGTFGLGDQGVEVKASNGNTTRVSTSVSGLDGEFQFGWTF